MIIVEQTGTADNNDFLSGTDLDNIPSDGVLIIQGASTVGDTLLTITGPGGEPVVRGQCLVQRANSEIREDDPDYPMGVTQGGHYVVDVNVQTAGTWRLRATYVPLEELAALE